MARAKCEGKPGDFTTLAYREASVNTMRGDGTQVSEVCVDADGVGWKVGDAIRVETSSVSMGRRVPRIA